MSPCIGVGGGRKCHPVKSEWGGGEECRPVTNEWEEEDSVTL